MSPLFHCDLVMGGPAGAMAIPCEVFMDKKRYPD
jgi:hypothetical protein